MADRVSAQCPREGCDGTIRMSKSLPAGTYPCICRATQVRLSWATMANFERVPMVSVAESQDGGEDRG